MTTTQTSRTPRSKLLLPCAVCGRQTTLRRVEEQYAGTAQALGSTRGLPVEGYCCACRTAEREYAAETSRET